MAIKAVAVDDENTQHLIIGLNRDNVDSLLDGDVFTLPHGIAVTLTENSDIVLLFAETDDELAKRFPRGCGPFRDTRQSATGIVSALTRALSTISMWPRRSASCLS
jgi:hypothetical protein